jgi:type IV secretory pathway component VirB8
VDKELELLNRQFYASWLTSRLMTIFALLVMFGFACACSVILWLIPLKEVKPYLVSAYNKDSQVVKVEPLELHKSSLKKLTEIKCREFVMDLHTFDGQTEAIRFKRLSTMASDDVMVLIDNFLNIENQSSVAKKLQEEKIVRSVKVQHVVSLSPEDSNMWRVDWELLEIVDQVQKHTNYVSVITAETQTKTLRSGEDDINPIGFNVTAYSVRVIE